MAPPLPPASRRSGLGPASGSIVEMMQVERVQQGGARGGPPATLHPYLRLLSVMGGGGGGGGGGRRTWGDAVTLRSLQVQPGSPRGQLCFNASGLRTPGTVLRLVLRRRVLEFKNDLQGEGDFLSVGVSVLSVHPSRPPHWLDRSTISLARHSTRAAPRHTADAGSGSKTGLQHKPGTGRQLGGGSESEGGLQSGPGVEPTAKPEPGSEVERRPRLEFGLPVGPTGKPESGLELDPPGGVGPKPQPTPRPESKPGSDPDPGTGPISKPGARSESGPRQRAPPPPPPPLPPPVASPNPGPGVRREPDQDRGFAGAAPPPAAPYDVFDVTAALSGAGDPASLCFSLRFSDEAGSLVLHHELARSFYALEHRGGGDGGASIDNDANNNNANNNANHNAAPPLLLAYVDLPAR
ncbi:WAS/WASL-interacting protein family member 1-like [Lethenteron reissneri]|uniref:WAS/WASL-interacting protein family member 1-like n=1 Tax=Lethenteron reissneri TaxID=7753 RepID=UPI002AB6004E|nr:WAS/WASL-interacting protein family member 1-like [Lethenteron reissneri]